LSVTVTPRVFAYGGTSFDERRRIGEWTKLPMSIFEDYLGLRGGLPWFGFFAPDAQRPFLAWRVLQHPEQRGGYPFTLLLDPGDDVYERFEWNTGRLLAALFEQAGQPGRPLLEQPQRITADDLHALLVRLPTQPGEPLAEASTPRLYWVAGALADRVLAVPPSALSLAQRPSASWVARCQDLLPIGLRNGRGWLVGGSSAQAQQLGARLVLDDHATVEDASVLATARDLLAAVDRVTALPTWAKPLAEGWLRAPSTVRRAREAVAVFADPNALVDFAERLSGDERRQWVTGACTEVLKVTRAHGARVTRFLLSQAFDGTCRLEAKHFKRLDRATVDEFLDSRHIPPNAPPAALGVPVTVLVERWEPVIANSGVTAPDRVRDALDQVGESDALIDAGWRAAIAAGAPLGAWTPLLRAARVREHTRAEARRRGRDASRPFAPDEYTEFADDPTWSHLHDDAEPPVDDAMPRIVDALLARRRADDIDRLRRLAAWPARRTLSRERRAELAAVAGGPWRAVALLDELVAGARVDGVEAAEPNVRAILEEDLSASIRTLRAAQAPPPPPNLAGLNQLLGALPEAARAELAGLEPSLEEETAGLAWIEAWNTLDPMVSARERDRMMSVARQKALAAALTGDGGGGGGALPTVDALRETLRVNADGLARTSPEMIAAAVIRFAGSAPHLAVLLDALDEDQRTQAAAVVWKDPRVKLDRAFPMRPFRRAIETIRGAGSLGIVLARAVLAMPDTARAGQPKSWWSRLRRK
jgi:hypothetical protein